MNHVTRRSGLYALLVGLFVACGFAGATDTDWPQWGGPNRNFTVDTSGLADQWPPGGPRKLWHRTLGDGYSSIVAHGDMLYTMCRKGPDYTQEYTVCLDAKTGKTIWEQGHPAPPGSAPDYSSWGGGGPNSTPLIVGERLFTLGSRTMMHCRSRTTGDVLWKHDLEAEYRGTSSGNSEGYSPSPIAYKNLVIVLIGHLKHNQERKGQSLVAFDQESGRVVWKSQDFVAGASSPILINFAGKEQIVLLVADQLLGINPADGRLLWRYDYPMRYRTMIVTPVWNGDDLIFCRAGAQAAEGTSTVRLTERDGRIIPEELWTSTKLSIFVPTPVHIGDHLYGAVEQGLVAIDFKTGERKWVQRRFPNAACIHADGKLIILDENGKLTLTTATPEELTVLAQDTVTERYSYSVPTLVGTTLYVRDRRHIMALDLGKPGGSMRD
ncbi:MAG: PQQ-like beta-propeller repeat protein [Phycisphaerales bacterium]|nr:MAG: PQQ-like beta-propeller repeat protein [Phycisphaerales bacterium]